MKLYRVVNCYFIVHVKHLASQQRTNKAVRVLILSVNYREIMCSLRHSPSLTSDILSYEIFDHVFVCRSMRSCGRSWRSITDRWSAAVNTDCRFQPEHTHSTDCFSLHCFVKFYMQLKCWVLYGCDVQLFFSPLINTRERANDQ